MFEVITSKSCEAAVISFNFWDCSVNSWSVFCSFFYWLYIWNKNILRYSFYIISDQIEKLFSLISNFFKFSEAEFLLTISVMASAFGVQGSIQKCHPWFLKLRTNKRSVSNKKLFETRIYTRKLILTQLSLHYMIYCNNAKRSNKNTSFQNIQQCVENTNK